MNIVVKKQKMLKLNKKYIIAFFVLCFLHQCLQYYAIDKVWFHADHPTQYGEIWVVINRVMSFPFVHFLLRSNWYNTIPIKGSLKWHFIASILDSGLQVTLLLLVILPLTRIFCQHRGG